MGLPEFLAAFLLNKLLDAIGRRVKVTFKEPPDLIVQIEKGPLDNPQTRVSRRRLDSNQIYDVEIDIEIEFESEQHQHEIVLRDAKIVLWSWRVPWRIWWIACVRIFDPEDIPRDLKEFKPIIIPALGSKHVWLKFWLSLPDVTDFPRRLSAAITLDFRGYRSIRRRLDINWANAWIRGGLA